MFKRLALVLVVAAGALVGAVATASSSSAATINCSGTYWGGTFGSIIVQPYTQCRIGNATITGSVTVKGNASFESCNDEIDGSIAATQAYVNLDNDTFVDGNVTLLKPGAQLVSGSEFCNREIGSYGYTSYICPEFIGGNLNVQNGPHDSREVSVGDCGWMEIGGSYTISGNRQLVESGYFDVFGSLVCLNNWPQPEFFGPFEVHGQIIGCALKSAG